MNLLSINRPITVVFQQRNAGQCGQCVVAMLAGIDRMKVCKAIRKWGGTTKKDMVNMLRFYGFAPGPVTRTVMQSPVEILAVLVDRNDKDSRHWVLWFHNRIICPNEGANPEYLRNGKGKIVSAIPVTAYRGEPVAAKPGTEPILKGPNGRNICRCGCGREAKPPRRNWFNKKCVDDWLLLNDWRTTRRAVENRDKGVCVKCGLDTVALNKAYWKAWEKNDFDVMRSLKNSYPGFETRRDYWEADHIKERAAGGTNELTNLQTLCVPCHRKKTVHFNKTRNRISVTLQQTKV